MSDAGHTLIPVTILTGFLGSGKTTLLGKLLTCSELADSAVIINEIGEVAIDHHLVRNTRDDIVVLANGCACCTVRGDLIGALRDMLFQRGRNGIARFPRVFIETTGLADPAPVMHALVHDPFIMQHFRLDGIVTTVDAVLGDGQLDKRRESVKQAAIADRIVVTKRDLASETACAALVARLRRINPAAPLLFAEHGEVSPRDILNTGLAGAMQSPRHATTWIAADSYRPLFGIKGTASAQPQATHDDKVRSFALRAVRALEPYRLLGALEILCALYGESILRVKGILNLEGHDRPQVLHIVQHVVYPLLKLESWPTEDRSSALIFIVHDLDPGHIYKVLASAFGSEFMASPTGESTAQSLEHIA